MSENEQFFDLNYAVYLRIQEIMVILDIKSISKLAEMSGVNKSTISTLKKMCIRDRLYPLFQHKLNQHFLTFYFSFLFAY